MNEPTAIPPLRPELLLLPGPPAADGSPTGILYDPLTESYDAFGWAEGEIIARLRRPQSLDALISQLATETTVPPDVEGITAFLQQLQLRGLLEGTNPPDTTKRHSLVLRLLSHYLFFRLPLIRPDPLLRRTLWIPRFLGSVGMKRLYLILAVLALVLFVPRSGMLLESAAPFLAWNGIVWLGLSMAVVKILHEFSHAYAAAVRGVRVRSMGLFFMVMTPIPYSDITDSWRLPRKDRLAISSAGVRTELVLAAVALLGWSLASPGPIRDVSMMVSTAALASTLLTNLNPGMRFDGYYLFADLIGVDNLQHTAFQEARRFFHGLFLRPAHQLPAADASRKKRALLVVYAVYVTLYRLAVYTGIALLVYHYFPKALGIILFAVEIAAFIVRPIVREIALAIRTIRHGGARPRFLVMLVPAALFLIWAFVPFPRTIRLDAAVTSLDIITLYAPGPGRLVSEPPARGDVLPAGSVILAMDNNELDANITARRLEYESAFQELDSIRAGFGERDNLQSALADVDRLASVQAALQAEKDRYLVRAESDVRVLEIADQYRVGNHVARRAFLGRFVPDHSAKTIVSYLPESSLGQLRSGDEAVFIPNDNPADVRAVTITTVARESSRHIQEEALLAPFGGSIPVQTSPDGSPVPAEPLYRMEALFNRKAPGLLRLGQTGVIRATGRSDAPGLRALGRIGRILRDESGF